MVRFFVTIVGLCAIFLATPGCRNGALFSDAPRVQGGVLDLREWDFVSGGPVNLSGEYWFYWGEFRSPALPPGGAERFIAVPGDWNGAKIDGQTVRGEGFATYQLLVQLPPGISESLAFKVYDVATAFRLFVNGDTLLTVGQPGTDAAGSIPAYFPQVVEFTPRTNVLNIVIHVSNFHHRRGGIWDVIRLGTATEIRKQQEITYLTDFFLLGSIIMMGLYHCGLFLLSRKNRASLYLGLFCFSIGLRLCTTEEIYLLHIFPGISWQNLVRLEYLSLYALVPVFALFLYSLFPKEFRKLFVFFMFVIGGFCILLVVLTPVKIFSYTSPVYQVFLILSMLYGFHVLAKSFRRKKEGAGVILTGFVVLFLTAINDILNVNSILQNGELAAVGLFVFISIQAFYLARRFTMAMATVERQREKLARTNRQYIAEIQERKRAEEEKIALQGRISRSEKLEMLGRLAGTVAHELNNILAVMVLYPEIIEADLPKDSPALRPLSQIKAAALNAGAIIQDLLTLARRGGAPFKSLNLNDIIIDFLASPEYTYLIAQYPHIQVETQLASSLPNLHGSEIHLRNTVMNLIKNAAEAQPAGGTIMISTNRLQLTPANSGHLNIPPGNYVVLRVKDNGVGIDPADQPHIFEPFYTTKSPGKSGTGLGMSVVWGTVQDHHGYIKVDSAVGRGTTISLYFPESAAKTEPMEERPEQPFEKYCGNGEKVLVVDDQPAQREMIKEVLQRLGYEPHTTPDGEAALAFLQQQRVDLVVLDLLMSPELDGVETCRRMRAIQPDLPVVVVSGDPESERYEKIRCLGVQQLLHKPCTVEKLARAVKAGLGKCDA